MGKCGVGKSSTVNSIIGERAVTINQFQSEGLGPVMVSCSVRGFTLNVIDTPGLVNGGHINDQALEIIKQYFPLNKTIDILLYVDRLDTYRMDKLDELVMGAITDRFGKEIWNMALIVLTHAQFSPQDGLPYDEFVLQKSGALLKALRQGARLKEEDDTMVYFAYFQPQIAPLVLPNGTAWTPNLLQQSQKWQ
ncbi:Translocase of chloroplast 34 [Spatholobus suberectus]|nr:Translocase of chloroplast 34 [Spatholobus suberectus]